jgi:hypothetical protein
MSRACVILSGLIFASGLTLTASPTSGQTVEELRARVARIAELLEEIDREKQEEERARNEELMSRLDTLRIGRLSLITTPEYAEKIEETARQQWEVVEPALRPPDGGEPGEEFVFYFGLPYPPEPGIGEMEGSVHGAIGRVLAARLDPDSSFIRELPFEPLARGWAEAVYVALATAESRSARFCFLGDLDSCRDVLGLSDLSDPLTVWYAPEERRGLVGRINWYGATDVWRNCVDEGLDDACLEFLRTVRPEARAPLPIDARRMLLDVALVMGGEGTYARISTSSGSSVEERLAAAVGVEPDTLIAGWREAVLDVRPRTQAVSGWEGLGALAWVFVLAFLGTRSSRWRSG